MTKARDRREMTKARYEGRREMTKAKHGRHGAPGGHGGHGACPPAHPSRHTRMILALSLPSSLPRPFF